MSELKFTDGNLIVLYALYNARTGKGGMPDHIVQRVKTCLETFNMVMKSKPDRHKTMVLAVCNPESASDVKQSLVQGGVDEKIIAVDTESANMGETFASIHEMIMKKPNPPFVYFIGSYWLNDIFTSTVVSKMKGLRVQFYGAMDQRPIEEIEKEKAADAPKKGTEYYKQKAKNKAVDMLLNIIFPD